jgi:serine/threonine protein phosphatase PrpC
MSIDHKPNSREERTRIEDAGGVVVWAGTWRVGGVLAVSRAFGDRPLKRYVIPTPDIKDEVLTAEDDCLILASDGLWDVVSNQVRSVAPDALTVQQPCSVPAPTSIGLCSRVCVLLAYLEGTRVHHSADSLVVGALLVLCTCQWRLFCGMCLGCWLVSTRCCCLQDAVAIVKDIAEADKAARRLVDEAYQRGSNDNISCVVLKFRF